MHENTLHIKFQFGSFGSLLQCDILLIFCRYDYLFDPDEVEECKVSCQCKAQKAEKILINWKRRLTKEFL